MTSDFARSTPNDDREWTLFAQIKIRDRSMPDRKNEAGGAAEGEAEERVADDAPRTLGPVPGPARRPASSSSPAAVLVLFRGLPAVGKSTLARAVSLELGNSPLIDKDDTRDALAEVFTERARGEQGGGGGGGGGEQGGDLFRQRLNEASYAAAFNAARTLLASSRCPCVLLDSPLSRPSAAERALRLAEELKGSAPAAAAAADALAVVVVAVGTSDEGLWKRRLESRAAALAASGSFSAGHKPRRWAEVEALRDRGRRELLLLLPEEEDEDEEEEKEEDRGDGDGRREGGNARAAASLPPASFREEMLRDLGVDRPSSSSSPFSRLWKSAFARFVVDTAAAGEEAAGEGEERGAFSKAAAGRVAAAVRSALAGEERPPFDNDDGNGNVVFIEG